MANTETIKQRFDNLIEDLKRLIPDFEGSKEHQKVLDTHEAVQSLAGGTNDPTTDGTSPVVPDTATGANVSPGAGSAAAE